jgi:hypothetical protein
VALVGEPMFSGTYVPVLNIVLLVCGSKMVVFDISNDVHWSGLIFHAQASVSVIPSSEPLDAGTSFSVSTGTLT